MSLILFFQIFPYEVDGRSLETAELLMGFGHEALITICALMIVGKALENDWRSPALSPLPF